MLITDIIQTSQHLNMYVPTSVVGNEIIIGVNMKDGCLNLNKMPIVDDDGNGIALRSFLIGYHLFYGDIGMSENFRWTKVLLVPFSKHKLLQFSKLAVCSMYLRGDASTNFNQAVSMAPAHGISIPQCVMKITFGRANKKTLDNQMVTTRPAQFAFVPPEGDESTYMAHIAKEINTHLELIKTLVKFNSGNNIISISGPNAQKEMAEFKRDKEIAFSGGSSSYYALPEHLDSPSNDIPKPAF